VSLARALALQPSVLVVDEPTTGLDVVAAADVDDALATVVAGVAGVAGDVDVDGAPACALVVITHHPRTRARLARLPRARALVVAQGQLLPEAA
jgi:ABC-type transporter Mla maintaining outer membrane lipid asymmetry ATPase subunit MlaF